MAENEVQVAGAESRRRRRGYNAASLISLFVPISLCMLLVVVTVNTVTFYAAPPAQYTYLTPFEGDPAAAWSSKLWQSLVNVAIFLLIVIVTTVAIVLLYKYRCYKVLLGWMILASVMFEYTFSFVYLCEVFLHYNIPMDCITLALSVWNYGTVAMICIFWKGPLRLQQEFLVISSALVALVMVKYLPEWTLWFLLGTLCLWDMVAVLCPFGPLRILVEIAQERNEQLFPSLIYSTGMVWMADSAEGEDHHDTADSAGGGGVKLGLGDFIFYSVLVGRASISSDLVVTIICFVAILVRIEIALRQSSAEQSVLASVVWNSRRSEKWSTTPTTLCSVSSNTVIMYYIS